MLIHFNGKPIDTSTHTLHEFCKQHNILDRVIILNGYQTSADYPLNQNDNIVAIKKGEYPSEAELESMLSARHSPHIYAKLKSAKVAIAGIGGLGSNIAIMLTRIGVGQIFVVDFDTVDASNINRQNYYISHIGMFKTTALIEQLSQINPFVKLEYKTLKITPDNVVDLFKDYDIVCEAFDNPSNKAMLIENLLAYTNVKIVAGSG
ncbi:MAG: thiamine biosynthesis protein ThiF, partial [Epulopiscium sp. Nuni2H_MBin003]